MDLLPKLKLEMIIADSESDRIVGLISEAARTGKIGDGKIFISAIEEAVRIRDGGRDEGAL